MTSMPICIRLIIIIMLCDLIYLREYRHVFLSPVLETLCTGLYQYISDTDTRKLDQ